MTLAICGKLNTNTHIIYVPLYTAQSFIMLGLGSIGMESVISELRYIKGTFYKGITEKLPLQIRSAVAQRKSA